MLNLLECVKEFDVSAISFFLQVARFTGMLMNLPVTENTPWAEAESPYARTKQMGENILKDFALCQTLQDH